MPEGVKSIGKQAFFRSNSLRTISFPNSVVSIGANALSPTQWYTNQAEGMTYAGNVAYKYKGTLPEDASIELKEGTMGIADEIFMDSTKLASYTLPESLTTIGESAFRGCQLYTVTIQNPEPCQLSSTAFANASADAILYVPSGSKEAYEAASYWNEFKKILEMKPLGDINGDGKVTIADVTRLVDIFLGKK